MHLIQIWFDHNKSNNACFNKSFLPFGTFFFRYYLILTFDCAVLDEKENYYCNALVICRYEGPSKNTRNS